MKVMTFNIQHALDFQKRIIDTDLFVRAIQKHGADVCGLNEVRGAGPIEGYTDQAPAIGDGLSFHHYFGEAIKVGGTSPYGNAIVSRAPFKSVETIAIPDPEDKSKGGHFETRCVVKAVIDCDRADVCFLVCHMGLNLSERQNAVQTICGLIDSCDLPVVLMGDFNTLPDSPELQPLRERLKDSTDHDAVPGDHTFPSDVPNIKIDYIFYRGLECVKTTTIHEIYADHLPVLAEFKLS